MSNAARTIVDGARDLHRRVSDFSGASVNYAEIAEGYARLDIQSGSAVMILAPNSFEFVLHWIAIVASGLVPVAISPSTRSTAVLDLKSSLQISAIVGARLDPARYATTTATDIGTLRVIRFDDVPPAYAPYEALILTTGTSGAQTACVHSIEALACNAQMTARAIGLRSSDRQLIVLPMYHTYGLVTQGIGSILGGCELKIDGPPFNNARFAEIVAREKITVCGITPTLARGLLQAGEMLPTLRSLSIGGDVIAAEDVRRLVQMPSLQELYVTYGLTEAGPRVAVLPAHAAPTSCFDSVGRSFEEVTTVIENPDPDGVGQLLVKTPSALRRKVGANVTRQPMRPDGFLETGDLFTKDAEGYLRFVGRTRDFLVIKGEKVNTKSISQIVQMHPEVEFAKTTGQAEDQLVTTVWSRDNRAIDLDGLKAFLNGRLRRHEMPVRLVQEYSPAFHK
jgi:long-chain acyl-CoA synthetase